MQLTLVNVTHNPLAAMQARAKNPRPALEKWVDAIRKGKDSVDEQHRQRTTIFYGGRRRKWKDRQPFGDFPRRGTGRRHAAWIGAAAGSVARVTQDSVTVGVDSAVFPQERGLQGGRTVSRRVTDKQRAFLHRHGVHLRRTTRFLRTEPRPVRINTPGILGRCKKILVRYVIAHERLEALLS